MEAHSDSDWLDVIVFDTSSWGPATDVDRLRWWKRGSAAINLRFFDMAPDFESLDPEYLRETLMESMGLVEAHGWPAEEVIGVTSTTMPTAHPTENMLIEVNVDSIQGVPVLSHTMRFLYEGQIRFATTLVILFKMCCWMLRMEVEDAEPVGEREAAVFRNVLEGRTTLEDFQEMVHPYERRWDGLIALEADPLSELRTFTEELVSSIRFGAIASELEPFVAE